ncbi:beta family protein [Methylobacter sp.]|uniref:beta family protein n=1 Tax=Methylobacter sp. TaxID=2051955 RepID=UPI003DA527A4
MNPIYVPILKAKEGEFEALIHLSERANNQVIPWFDVPPLDERTRITSETNSEPAVESYLNKKALGIADAWLGKPIFYESKPIFMDLPRWAPNAQTESGEHVIPYFRNRLEHLGVIVNPVVKYDVWDDPVYVNAFKSIRLENGQSFCIRLTMDVDTVADIKADPDYVSERLSDIVRQLKIDPVKTYLLIDFGDISSQADYIEEIIDKAKQAFFLARESGFSQIMLAGSSLPTSISLAVKKQNDTALVLRKEMKVWKTLLSENQSQNIIFADYGVRSPNSNDGSMFSPNTNGKIRYTIDNQYFIVRGYPLNVGLKYHQSHGLAQIVINSEHYLDQKFSWGDKQVSLYSNPEYKSGNPQAWIAIDTNHHIETVLMEILEFRHQLIAKKARSNQPGLNIHND